MKTLLLDQVAWDICKDANGNIAVASEPYAVAQDVASECRVFFGEVFYDTSRGVHYFEEVLGFRPPLSALRSQYVTAALTVPTVVEAQCFFNGLEGRKLTGQIQVTDSSGGVQLVGF